MDVGSPDDSAYSFPDDLLTALAPLHVSDAKTRGFASPASRRLSVKELKILRSEIGSTCQKKNTRARIVGLWRSAYRMVLRQGDPWAEFQLDKLPVEVAKRYRYSALKSKWVEDMVRVRMDSKPFGRGAMRECFRTKKLSNFSANDDWSHASNFVAKRYLEKVGRQVYFDDVRLQMDAKLWAEEFSRQPGILKKVDIAQMCVLEFVNRPDKPLYHLEHFIEGTYRKYNSNSGFVDDFCRNTPQAFSHFTFEQSGHHLIVVDIQGVGDLWTDPQIHTFDGNAYGDGNLGIRGMALFLHTHRCNPLCTALQLDPFDLHPDEQRLSALIPHRATCNGAKGDADRPVSEQFLFGPTVALPRSCRRQRSETGSVSTSIFVDPADFTEAHSLPNQHHLAFLPTSSPIVSRLFTENDTFGAAATGAPGAPFDVKNGGDQSSNSQLSSSRDDVNADSGVFFVQQSPPSRRERRRYRNSGMTSDSLSEDDFSSQLQQLPFSSELETAARKEAELVQFFEARRANHRSSSVGGLLGQDASHLGIIHHEMARLHAIGRFASTETASPGSHADTNGDGVLAKLCATPNIHWDAVVFHEEQAAVLHCLEAVQCLAQYYLGLEINGPLDGCPLVPDPGIAAIRGLTYMSTAATAGDRRAMIYLAEINYTGRSPLNPAEDPDWATAVHWYEKAIEVDDASSSRTEEQPRFGGCGVGSIAGYDSMSLDWPVYRLHGRLGELYAKGGHGLRRDCAKAYAFFESAADGANEAMQGRLAMTYYDQAAALEEELDMDD